MAPDLQTHPFVAIGRYVAKKSSELDEQNIGQKVKKYLAFMNGRNIKIGNEQIEEISIRSSMTAPDFWLLRF